MKMRIGKYFLPMLSGVIVTFASTFLYISAIKADVHDSDAVVLKIEKQLPKDAHRLSGNELRQFLVGKMLVPVQRIRNRWDECDEYFPQSGGWSKCGNPSGVIPFPYFSKVVEYKNSYFCVNVETFKYRRCSIIYHDSTNRYYIVHRYSRRFMPSLIEVRISQGS